jgi:hypothetical protein
MSQAGQVCRSCGAFIAGGPGGAACWPTFEQLVSRYTAPDLNQKPRVQHPRFLMLGEPLCLSVDRINRLSRDALADLAEN